jgi:hypothetical protein
MIAEQAGKMISKFIGRSWPDNMEEVYEILVLGINKAWKEGKWLGMTAEFTVPVNKDINGRSYIIGPPSHPILQAINANSLGTAIRDTNFMFHKNGYGDIRNSEGCEWSQEVYDLGEAPYLENCKFMVCEGVKVGVRAMGIPGPNEKVFVNGSFYGQKVFTYKNGTISNAVGCPVDTDNINPVQGVEIPITENFNYISNVDFTSITAISKTLTRTPVEVVAIHKDGPAFPIATLNPQQTKSGYRKYLVPTLMCNKRSVHCIFKIAPQEHLIGGSDMVIIDDMETLISLAKAIDSIYYKEQLEVGSQYFLQAISLLDKNKREQESPNEFPIQVSVLNYGDTPNALRYLS